MDVREASAAAAAGRIAADEVDVLVDLMGYTKDCRTEILACRPAPIQVNYLGYPGTMGAGFMDYILVDDYIVPPDQQPFFSEKLVHLPGCYQVNDSRREISPRAPSREECNLPAEGFVFCSFNNSYKITPEIFAVVDAVADGSSRQRALALGEQPFRACQSAKGSGVAGSGGGTAGVAPARLCPNTWPGIVWPTCSWILSPYNAHTTASDALWAGLPLLTLAGRTFASRVAGSLLRTIGLPELIATSLEDYEATALRLARDRAQLADLRARLEANRTTCGLFDGGRFARNLEKAYATMWEIYRSGEEPRTFTVSAT